MSANVKHALAYIVVVVAAVFALVTYVNHQEARNLEARIAMCEEAKKDRLDAARAWTRAERTWTHLATSGNLPKAEREVAHQTAIKYGESANQLRIRLYHCKPLVTDAERILDRDAVDEALAKL